MNPTIVSFDALHRFTAEAFRRTCMSDADAITGADVLATTDAWGVFTHGTKCLAGYLRRLQAGGLRPQGGWRVGDGGWRFVARSHDIGVRHAHGDCEGEAAGHRVCRRAQ